MCISDNICIEGIFAFVTQFIKIELSMEYVTLLFIFISKLRLTSSITS